MTSAVSSMMGEGSLTFRSSWEERRSRTWRLKGDLPGKVTAQRGLTGGRRRWAGAGTLGGGSRMHEGSSQDVDY